MMDFFDGLTLIGGLALFLFGMSLMGSALEKRAGNRLRTVLGSMTSSPLKGFLLGLAVTAVIQSSSATTVMVVGFVNSGVMTLRQAIGVIMGANLGTSVTAWILSLTGIQGTSFFVQLLKPSSFTPLLGFIGIILYLFQKNAKKKDTGMILLGFAVLMFGMEAMASAVAGLSQVPGFVKILSMFSNPFLGVLAGAGLTAVIQSSSASVGILQALSTTGAVTYGAALPIILGQNIGTCVTALLSSIGTSKNARRAAIIHLFFNIIGTCALLPLYYLADWLFSLPLGAMAATPLGIAVVHSAFNTLTIMLLMPFTAQLEKLARVLVRESAQGEKTELLDTRLLATPSVAVTQSRKLAVTMAELAVDTLSDALGLLTDFSEKTAERIREAEDRVDTYEDKLGSYLVKLSAHGMSRDDSAEISRILHVIGDFERISDHAVNIVESAEEMFDKRLAFSNEAQRELFVMSGAVTEILGLALRSFRDADLEAAATVEPLEQVVDDLKEAIRNRHISRLQKGGCTIELGFVLTDLLTNLERVSDHCSNVACCMLEMAHEDMDVHEYLKNLKSGGFTAYNDFYDYYRVKYAV